MIFIQSVYIIMKALFVYNFNQSTMKTAINVNQPTLGGQNSAFSPYRVHAEVGTPEIIHARKDAFRRLKRLFGLTEQVGVDNSNKPIGASQK